MRINYVFVGLWIDFFGPSFMHLVMSCMNVREAESKYQITSSGRLSPYIRKAFPVIMKADPP